MRDDKFWRRRCDIIADFVPVGHDPRKSPLVPNLNSLPSAPNSSDSSADKFSYDLSDRLGLSPLSAINASGVGHVRYILEPETSSSQLHVPSYLPIIFSRPVLVDLDLDYGLSPSLDIPDARNIGRFQFFLAYPPLMLYRTTSW